MLLTMPCRFREGSRLFIGSPNELDFMVADPVGAKYASLLIGAKRLEFGY